MQSAEVKTLSTGGGGGLGLRDGWSNRIVIEKDLRHRNEPDFVPASFFFFCCVFGRLDLVAGCSRLAGCGLRVGGGSWRMGLDNTRVL